LKTKTKAPARTAQPERCPGWVLTVAAKQTVSSREVLADQLFRGCCIDRLSWHDLPGLSESPWYKRLVRRVLGFAAFAVLLSGVLDRPVRPSAYASRNNDPVGQTAAFTQESVASLQSQLEAILEAAKASDSKHFDDLLSGLRIPDSANWFTATFGDELGKKLAATYSDSWSDYKRDVDGMFHDSGTKKHTHAFVEKFSASSLVHHDAFIQSILQSAKGPLALYTAGAGTYRKSDALPGVYIFAQGSFRVVNWRTFYDLPNVEPTRIQVNRIQHDGQVSSPNTVMVRVVIDRDGVVALAQPVSGPPQLFDSSVRTIRLSRFKPQTRNGAPVEIDTTIPVADVDANIKPL
jgi:hypothetical protein